MNHKGDVAVKNSDTLTCRGCRPVIKYRGRTLSPLSSPPPSVQPPNLLPGEPVIDADLNSTDFRKASECLRKYLEKSFMNNLHVGIYLYEKVKVCAPSREVGVEHGMRVAAREIRNVQYLTRHVQLRPNAREGEWKRCLARTQDADKDAGLH